VHDRTAGVAPLDRDEALGLQDPQRLPHRGSADAEFGDEAVLVGQELSVLELAIHDPLSQHVGNELCQLRLPELCW
jgi:hypothetical protein